MSTVGAGKDKPPFVQAGVERKRCQVLEGRGKSLALAQGRLSLRKEGGNDPGAATADAAEADFYRLIS